jgi:hypothetical protein
MVRFIITDAGPAGFTTKMCLVFDSVYDSGEADIGNCAVERHVGVSSREDGFVSLNATSNTAVFALCSYRQSCLY